MTAAQGEAIRRLLCSLQDHILVSVLRARRESSRDFARIEAVTPADTIYGVDRISEGAIRDWFVRRWPRAWPVEWVVEGWGEGTTFPEGTPVGRTLFKCILDPIDGTRGLMYDKRSAWSLAGVAPQRGRRTGLADIAVAAMTEIPTSKQGRADQISAVGGAGSQGVVAESIALPGGRRLGARARIRLQPSRARDCRGGFASVAKFFPEGKVLLARFETALWEGLYGSNPDSSPVIFDDQYIATGGQIHELLAGRDRLTADLRPLAFAKLGLSRPMTCHPYDICTALILREAGGLVEAPDGRPLRALLDTTSPVAWVGYANAALARHARPEVRRLVKKFFG